MKFRILSPESDISPTGTLTTDMVFHYFEKCRASFVDLIGCQADVEFDLFEVTIMPTAVTWNVLDVHVDVIPNENKNTHYLFLNITTSDVDIALAKYETYASDFTVNNLFKKYLKRKDTTGCVILSSS